MSDDTQLDEDPIEAQGQRTINEEFQAQAKSKNLDEIQTHQASHASDLELLGGLTLLGAWFILFTCGVLVASTPLIDATRTADTTLKFVGYALLVGISWTLTNVGLLACISAAMGTYGRRTSFASGAIGSSTTQLSVKQAEKGYGRTARVHYASAVIRGFGVYALCLAGLLVLVTDSLLQPEQPEYIRLAATISIVSFYAGYDPKMFAGVLERTRRFVNDTA